jgi:hypothetical protein
MYQEKSGKPGGDAFWAILLQAHLVTLPVQKTWRGELMRRQVTDGVHLIVRERPRVQFLLRPRRRRAHLPVDFGEKLSLQSYSWLPDGIFSNQIWVNFEGPCNGKCRHNLRPFGPFCRKLVYFVAIWSILQKFGIFCGHLVDYFPVLVCCTDKNLANPATYSSISREALLTNDFLGLIISIMYLY